MNQPLIIPGDHRNGAATAAPDLSVGAEQALIAAMLTDRVAIDAARAVLQPSSFQVLFHQVIFGVMLTMRARGEPADFVSVGRELAAQGKLDAAGGDIYLDALCGTPLSGDDAERDIQTVAEAARLRASKGAGTGQPGKRKPISERVVDLADVEVPGDLPLLFGQYLLKGNIHWLTGATGLGKSTAIFNIACALAEGSFLWGIECEQTRVLYADTESGDVGRAHKIERLYSGSPRVRGQLLFLREPIKLPDELDELLAYVQGAGVTLVIFDTARRVFSVRDENDNAEVYNRIIPTLDALKQIGVASLTLGHPSKSGNGSARGAGAQEDAGDVNLSLTMHNGADVNDPNAVIALRVTKNRLLGLGIPPLLLRRVGGDRFTRIEFGEVEAALAEETPSALDRCAADVEALLAGAGDPMKHTQIVKAMEAGGHANSTAKRAIKRLQEGGRIENDLIAGGYVVAADPEQS